MSIRLIAQELYRLQKEVERLEQALTKAPHDRKEQIADRLRVARAEHKRMRDVLDGQKDRGK